MKVYGTCNATDGADTFPGQSLAIRGITFQSEKKMYNKLPLQTTPKISECKEV
jgi:hypothetical protein